jgi:hypothetical protein
MTNLVLKVDEITIKVTGNKKFRQKIIDLIYQVLMTDEMQIEYAKPGCGIKLNSSIEPSDDVMI